MKICGRSEGMSENLQEDLGCSHHIAVEDSLAGDNRRRRN